MPQLEGPAVRRYLARWDLTSYPHVFTDVLVIGSGAAGLRAAIEAAGYGEVLLVTKEVLSESNTAYAQGGIAAAVGPGDNVESHAEDTLRVGAGLCNQEVVRQVVADAPELIDELVEWGASFDRDDGRLGLAREGGHSRPRIVHARGDATGQEIESALIRKAKEEKQIRVSEHAFALDLLTRNDTCHGAVIHDAAYGIMVVWAKWVILATGGAGQLYRETTNPGIATGDGMAMAYRAGAELEDLEFVQFHPTTLYVAGASRTLISEVVRGEDGRLVDREGNRFMFDYHPDGELAPRDVVSRAILKQMQKTNDTNVYLDVRHLPLDLLRTRFPNLLELCLGFDIDVKRDLIPVRPSAHYMIGGVRVDSTARTSLDRLCACGEVACTELHGANRLGSNSLLEALCFGKVAGRTAGQALGSVEGWPSPRTMLQAPEVSGGGKIDFQDVANSLKSLLWRNAGIERDAERLKAGLERVRFWSSYVLIREFQSVVGWQIQDMLTVAQLLIEGAIFREESRGVHVRTDFPETDDEHWQTHIRLRRPGTKA